MSDIINPRSSFVLCTEDGDIVYVGPDVECCEEQQRERSDALDSPNLYIFSLAEWVNEQSEDPAFVTAWTDLIEDVLSFHRRLLDLDSASYRWTEHSRSFRELLNTLSHNINTLTIQCSALASSLDDTCLHPHVNTFSGINSPLGHRRCATCNKDMNA